MIIFLKQYINIIVQAGGWALLGATSLVTYDVITRKLFNISIAGADEISGYIFAISTACAFSYALLSRANIRIDILYNLMPPLAQRLLDILSMAMMAGFLGIICYFAYDLAADAIKYESRSITPLQTPLMIPQSLWFGALALALLTSLVLVGTAIKALLQGDMPRVEKLIGVPSLDEEIEIELSNEPLNNTGDREG